MAEAEKPKGSNKLISIGLPLVITAVAVWLVLRQINFQDLGNALQQITVPSFLLLILLYTLGSVFRAVACWIILGGRVNFMSTFWGMSLGYLLNNIMPLRLGEFGRAAFISENEKGKIGFFEVLAAVVAERLLDLLVGFSFLIVCLLFMVKDESLKQLAMVGTVVLVIAIAFIFYATKNRDKVISWLHGIFPNSKFMQEKIVPAIEKLLNGFQFFVKPGRFVLSFAILAFSWTFSMVEYGLLQNIMLPTSEWWWPVLVIPTSAFANALPAAPAGLGVYEAGAVGAYALVGVAKAPALAMALITHAVQIIIPSLLGLVALMLSSQSLSGLINRATHLRQKKDDEQ